MGVADAMISLAPTPAHLLARAAQSTTSSASHSATATANPDSASRPPIYRVIGIILAITSGLFIGTSFVLKKTGLLKANKKYNEEAGEGYGYLKNAWWWSGMILMIVGEICNFVAYAFVDAILVTPMGSLSVVVTTILSAIFLKERLSFVGKVGCFNCIIGSVVIVVNSPEESSVATIQEMQSFVIAPGFLSYAGVIIVGCVIIALWAGPRYGKKSMLVYLSVCSLIGGLSVVATQGLGAAITSQVQGIQQFNQWFLYVLFVFVVATLITEIIYLNKALNIFNAALVTPTYYVYFTSATIVTSAILFRGFDGTGLQIASIVMGFLQICSGVVLLQLSKSAKDVPDAAVFKGDLDQVRTVGEQEEYESEPRADTIRGTAAIIRSFSVARREREQTEANRLLEERLEPIGENEQVEWDGLRRRKTVVAPGEMPQQRRKTIHPPLGMSHFPSDEPNADHDNANDDEGFFPVLRKRAQTMFSVKGGRSPSPHSRVGGGHPPVPLGDMSAHGGHESYRDAESKPGNQQQVNELPSDLKRTDTAGMSSLSSQDTSYNRDEFRKVQWAQQASRSESHLAVPGQHGSSGPTAPPQTRRQFSFQNMFSRPRSTSGGEDRPTSSQSRTSHGGFTGFISGWRKSSGVSTTEEESLGLVHGDSAAGIPQTSSPVQERGASPGGANFSRAATDGTDDDDNNNRVPASDPQRGVSGSSSNYNDGTEDSDRFQESPTEMTPSNSFRRTGSTRRRPYRPDSGSSFGDGNPPGPAPGGATFL